MQSSVFKDDLFEDKHVLITGGSRGLNFGIAEQFAGMGANLTLIARDQEQLDKASEKLRKKYSTSSRGYSSDVRDNETLSQVIEESADEFGEISVLICGAAGNFPAAAGDMSSNAFGSVIDIDLKGTFNTCRSAYEYLEREASIVAISAVQSTQPTPFQSHACAAKAGIDSLVKTLALEWADDDIRVNAIQPGPVKNTGGMDRLTPDDESKESLANALPAGRFANKEEVAKLVIYLSLPVSSYITGAVIPIDGGQTLIGSGKLMDSLLE